MKTDNLQNCEHHVLICVKSKHGFGIRNDSWTYVVEMCKRKQTFVVCKGLYCWRWVLGALYIWRITLGPVLLLGWIIMAPACCWVIRCILALTVIIKGFKPCVAHCMSSHLGVYRASFLAGVQRFICSMGLHINLIDGLVST
jgi:hypothetical protein